ncbi:MAG: PIG-L deacetylase family protein [Candidatus Competibacterales bacterium]
MARVCLALSPHLDDAAFSCGGLLNRLVGEGWRVVMATVFTASVRGPRGFALRCQTDKGIPAGVDYMALRRREDAACGRALGVEVRWLGLPEAPHRGYDCPEALFAGSRPDDEIWRGVVEAIDPLLAELQPALLLAPQGLGHHVDHLQLVHGLVNSAPASTVPTAWYRDTPYALRNPAAEPAPTLPRGLVEGGVALGEAQLAAKLAGCGCYASQLGFQFGGVDAMAEQLRAFARREGQRCGAVGSGAEVLVYAEGSEVLSAAFGSPWV